MITDRFVLATEIENLRLLVDHRDFEAANEAICRLLSYLALDVVEKSEILLLKSKSLYFSGHYDEALVVIREAIDLIKQTTCHSLYAEEKFVLGRILNLKGRHDEAIEELTESYAFFRRAEDPISALSPLMTIGLIHQTKGNLNQARVTFESISEKARILKSSVDHLLSTFNACRVTMLSGDICSAEAMLAAVSNQVELDIHRLRTRNLLGMISVWKLATEEARTLLTTSASMYRERNLSRDVAVCLEYLGLNEYFAGNYAKAREYYNQVLAMPEPTASAVAQTLRMLTDVEIAEGNWDAAKATAARADAAINKISERIELGALWRAYGHIHTHDNDYATAREYFEKSIDLLRQLGARYELALSHFDAGRSKAYAVEAQIEQLKAAKALFVEMEVPKRVAQVDEALGRLLAQDVCEGQNGKRKLTIKAKAVTVPLIIAESEAMKRIMALADRIKDNEMNILITGETGTGKDLLAEYIHSTGNRCDGPFTAINCAAVPENLLECELFGVKKGTFTGSTSDKVGLIESADGGTFYFDEIGDAPAAIQSKLLRVIETKTVRRLGSNEDVRVNVRFIAATNHNLQERIASKEFRRDLYYRLAEVEITLPPLRDRREDVMPLISRFLKAQDIEITTEQYGQLASRLNGYDWPGNVREVRHLVNVATVTNTNGGLIPALESALSLLNHPDATESKAALLEVLERHQGNISSVARELGIPRTTLISQLKKFGLL